MPTREANAKWHGSLKSGNGTMALGSGAYEGSYSFASRFEQGEGTNPEELIAAALAGCFSMALAHQLEEQSYSPKHIETQAEVTIDMTDTGFRIVGIVLHSNADIPDIEEKVFQENADQARKNCPVSQALQGTSISLEATLRQSD